MFNESWNMPFKLLIFLHLSDCSLKKINYGPHLAPTLNLFNRKELAALFVTMPVEKNWKLTA